MKTITKKILAELHAAGERRAVELPLSPALYPVACLREAAALSEGCRLELIERDGVLHLHLEVSAEAATEACRMIGELLNRALIGAVQTLGGGQGSR